MDFDTIKGEVIKCIAVFLFPLAHFISFISFVFEVHVFEEHFYVNYIFKILLPHYWYQVYWYYLSIAIYFSWDS